MATDTARTVPPRPIADWVVAHTPAPVRPAVELAVRTIGDALDDRVVGLAAEVAFFSILSLPPLLLTIIAALGFLPGEQTAAFVDALVDASQRVFTPSTVEEVVEPTLQAVIDTPRPDVLSIGFALSIFSASRALRVVLTAVTIAYDLETQRPSWAQRVYGVLATLGLLVVVPVLVPLLVAGPGFGRRLADSSLVPEVVADVWPVAYWPGVAVGAVLAVAALYHLGAPWWTPFRRDLPGAALAVGLWLASSAGLRTYTERTITGDELFQFLAGPLVLLVWLYLLALGVLLGAELNAELERMLPSPEQRRAPPGERLKQRIRDSDAAARIEQHVPGITERIRELTDGPDESDTEAEARDGDDGS